MAGSVEDLELQPLSSARYSRWKKIFEEFDRDGDGKIPTYEFRQTIQHQLNNRVPKEALKELLMNADRNHDGYITIDEFIRMVESKLGKKIMGDVWFRWYMTKVVGKHGVNQVYTSRRRPEYDDPDSEYTDQCRWCPPPLSMITASLIQIILFCFTFDGINNLRKNKVSEILIYDPYKREEAWRFLTYMLIHGGWEHLIVNVVVQLALGIPLELVHRWWRIMVVYLFGVVAGSLGTSVTDPKTFLCGASGGVYALMLAHISAIILNWAEMERPFIMLSFFLILMTADTGNAIYERYFKNVDTKVGYAAHFFGALTGLLLGLYVLRNLEVHRWEKRLKLIALVVFILLISFGILWNIFIL